MLCTQASRVQFIAGIQLVQAAQTYLFRIFIIFSYLARKELPKHPQFRFPNLSLQTASSHSLHTDKCMYDSIDWQERKLISRTVQGSVLKQDCSKGRQEIKRLEKELDKDAVCHKLSHTYTVNVLPMKLLKVFESSKQEGK